MNKTIEFRGKPGDKDMIEIKKSVTEMLKDSESCIIMLIKDNNCNLFFEGDNTTFSVMIGESMAQSKEFCSMIVNAIKVYQEEMN